MEKDWSKVTAEALRELYCDKGISDAKIAEMYGVKYSQVRYKRNKYGISIMDRTYEEFTGQNKNLFDVLNSASKSRLLQHGKMDAIAKAITRYAFRDGPVEDIHADGRITQEEMKDLNIFMINRMAGIINTILENQWLKIELLVDYYKGSVEWDEAMPDTQVLDEIYNDLCNEVYAEEK